MHSQSFIENLGLHGPHVAQNLDDRGEVSRQPDGLSHVGEVRLSFAPMTDDELEAAIVRAGIAMEAWYSHFRQSKHPEYLDMAYHFLGVQKTLIGRRSPEMVARLEAERGLT